MLDINLDDIDFSFREKLVDEASIVAGNILNIHGINTFDSPQFRLQYEPDHATLKIINRQTGESMASIRDGDGWIENGTNASPDLLHQFLQMQDRLEKEAREHQNSQQSRQQATR
ncbi:MAG: hypothetical protein SWJ54_19405 [Cyanobacteriota bacterium]|nr:hypothetical protein [Cyanobacteriota bacterium]